MTFGIKNFLKRYKLNSKIQAYYGGKLRCADAFYQGIWSWNVGNVELCAHISDSPTRFVHENASH